MGAHAGRMAVRPWPLNLLPRFVVAHARPLAPPPRRIGPLLALAFFALYAVTSSATLVSRDGGVMYDTAMALLNRHTLVLPPHHHGVPGIHGGFYSKYGIAQSVAEIPLLALGQALAAHAPHPLSGVLALAVTMLTNPLIMALAVWLFFLLAYEIGASVRGAALAALLIGAASPFWPYAKTDFSEPLSALSLIGAALFLVRARARPSSRNFALSGAFVILALLTKLTAALALPALGLYALFVAVTAGGEGRHAAALRRCAAWALPVAVGLALNGAYNLARYGHITDTGYHSEDLPFHAPLLQGLQGLLVSSGKGLLWYCPLVLLALALWPLLLSRRRAEGLLALGVFLPTLLVYATYPVWWGGVCWGPRYLVPVLPFLLLPLAFLLERFPRTLPLRRVAVTIIAVSVLVQALGVAVHPNRFPATLPTDVRDSEYLWSLPHLPLAGQAWLVAYDAVGLVDHADQRAMLANYPWRHAAGTSPGQVAAITHWDYWWWQILHTYGMRLRDRAAIAALLLLLLVVSLWGLRPLRKETEAPLFDHQHMAVHQ